MALTLNNTAGELVIDPYKNKEKYLKNGKILDGVSNRNQELVCAYLTDMEKGKNVSGVKGYRSFTRLNTLRSRMLKLAQLTEQQFNKNLDELSDDDAIRLFKDMHDGVIKKVDGKQYQSVIDYVKIFKAFWHWYIRFKRRNGIEIKDITLDLDTARTKPKFNYINFNELKILTDNAKYDYKVLMWFLYDSGMRAPTELMNVKRKDITQLEDGTLQLDIREETSKTFGRKIKLLLCSDMIKRYIKDLSPNEFIFKIDPRVANQYIKRLGLSVLKIKDLTMYDFRHSSACYWLPKYKSESALKYRFGWKQSEMIHYYTEFLGMKDTITEEDLDDAEVRTQLQKQLDQGKKERLLLTEKMEEMEKQMIYMMKSHKQNLKTKDI